jgi:hypothetical protein
MPRLEHFRTCNQFHIPKRITRGQIKNWIQGALLGHTFSRSGKPMADATRAWVLESKVRKNGIGPLMLELVKAKCIDELAKARQAQ